jgi:ankyrin repeat protein
MLESRPKADWMSRAVFYAITTSYACFEESDEAKVSIVKLLVAKGADVTVSDHCITNFKDDLPKFPLHLACRYGHIRLPSPQLVLAFLESGARVNATAEGNGRTALHILCASNYEDIMDDFEDELPMNVHYENIARFNSSVVECAKILLLHGANVNLNDRSGVTALHLACGENMVYRDSQLVRLLCESGANVNAVRNDDRSALHVLCSVNFNSFGEAEEDRSRFNSNVVECAKILLKSDADVDMSDDDGNYSEVLALSSGKLEVIDLLKAHRLAEEPTEYDRPMAQQEAPKTKRSAAEPRRSSRQPKSKKPFDN